MEEDTTKYRRIHFIIFCLDNFRRAKGNCRKTRKYHKKV